LALCDVCPSSEATGVAEVLLSCFESRNKVLLLLKAVIDREVFSTGNLYILYIENVDLLYTDPLNH
jgi:hypothetical protein